MSISKPITIPKFLGIVTGVEGICGEHKGGRVGERGRMYSLEGDHLLGRSVTFDEMEKDI